MSSSTVRCRGAELFRWRVVAAVLSGRGLRISDIRADDDERPGLQDWEASFLRLVESLTNGTVVQINETGTVLRLRPGVLTGGRVRHDCGTHRSIGWFAEAVLPLLLFCKDPAYLELSGVTNDARDLGVDVLRETTLPLLHRFAPGCGASLRVRRRGAPPLGGGVVELSVPVPARELLPLHLVEFGRVRRVRGVAFCTRVSPSIASRVVATARGVLQRLLTDVFIYTDHYRGQEGGASAGYSLCLVAETTKGVTLSVERTAEGGESPEDVGTEGAMLLLEEVAQAGCIDRSHQPLALLLMALGPEDVSKVRLGPLAPASIALLRHVRDVFDVVFKLVPDHDSGTVLASCLGSGFRNMARRVT